MTYTNNDSSIIPAGVVREPKWGGITGTLENQPDLAQILADKAKKEHEHGPEQVEGLAAALEEIPKKIDRAVVENELNDIRTDLKSVQEGKTDTAVFENEINDVRLLIKATDDAVAGAVDAAVSAQGLVEVAANAASVAAAGATSANASATLAATSAGGAVTTANSAAVVANEAKAQVAGLQQGTKPFDNYALLQAYTGISPDPAKGTFIAQVMSDPDSTKNGSYTWDATNSVWKPGYNPLNEAKSYTDGFVQKMEPLSGFIPISVHGNRVLVWIENGLLDAAGFGSSLGAFIGTAKAEFAAGMMPLAIYGSRVPVWLENGLLDAMGFGSSLREQIGTDQVDATQAFIPLSVFNDRATTWIENGLFDAAGFGSNLKSLIGTDSTNVQSGLIPLSVHGNRVCIWLENGLLDAAGFGSNLSKIISESVGGNQTPADSVTGRMLPLATDGVSLRRWKGNAAKVLNNTGQLRILVTGDSWAANMKIVPKLAEVLKAKYGAAGTGWLSVGNTQLDGVTIYTNGTWTIRDIMNDSAQMPSGCGPDGYTRYSDTANITYKLTGIPNASEFTIFHGRSVGSFRYRVNDGAWTTNTIDENGAKVQSVTINQANIVSYEMELLTGSIYLHGHHARSSSVGCEVSKAGHGGATAYDYSLFATEIIPTYSSYINPDVVVVILGTNDHRLSRSPVSVYKQGLRDLVNAYRSVNPTCGFVFVAPAKTNGVPLVPLSQYRDAALEMSYELQAEFYNMYDDWTDWATENSNGQWGDIFHVSDNVGALRFSAVLYKKFLEF